VRVAMFNDALLASRAGRGRAIKLTRREGRLVRLVAVGLRNKEIATAMSVSVETVRICLTAVLEKIGSRNRFELALFRLCNLRASEQGAPLKEACGDALPGLCPGSPLPAEFGTQPASAAPRISTPDSSRAKKDHGPKAAVIEAGAESRRDSGARVGAGDGLAK